MQVKEKNIMGLEQQEPSNIVQSDDQPEANRAADTTKHEIAVTTPTFGERFSDGSVIDRLANGQLVYWDGAQANVQPQFDLDGTRYVAAPLNPSLEQALVLPVQTEEHVSTERLLTSIRDEIRTITSLDESASLLLATFFMATWVASYLSDVPSLNVSPGTAGYLIISDLASVFCRRAVRVMDTSIKQLATLPPGLEPTLILQESAVRALERVLRVTAERYPVLLGGKVIRMPAPTIVLTTHAIEVATPVLRIQLPPTVRIYRRLLPAEAKALADRFQPLLLDYRLKQHCRVANSQFDCPGFNPETRIIARMLGACLEGADTLQGQLVEVLKSHDEERKIKLSQQPAAFVIEALLVAIHENRAAIRTQEVADLANAIMAGRGETCELSAKKVGSILRKLGIIAQRQGSGYTVTLTITLQFQVHHLACACGVLTLLTPEPLCECCHQVRTQADVLAQGSNGSNYSRNMHNVHDVHDVHESDPEVYDGPPREIDERSLDHPEGPM